jgi:hypothetical protein
MCHFLMTFGLKLKYVSGETIDVLSNKPIWKVHNNFIWFTKDGFVHSYNTLTKEARKLTSEIQIDNNYRNVFFVSHYLVQIVQEGQQRKLKIFDLERDLLVQTYDNYTGDVPFSSKRLINNTIVFRNSQFSLQCLDLSNSTPKNIGPGHRVVFWDRGGSDMLVQQEKGFKSITIKYNRIIENHKELNPLTNDLLSMNVVNERCNILGNYKYSKDRPDTTVAPKFYPVPMSFKQDVDGLRKDVGTIWKCFLSGTQVILWFFTQKMQTLVYDLA